MPKTLLLADDSVVIQKLVGLSFANEDVDLVTADNGDEAIARAKETRPDVVIADVIMPGKSGYEVCEAIRQDPELAGTPVLLLTGTFEAFDEDRATAVGADGHITKPFEAQVLVAKVRELLDKGPIARTATSEPPQQAGQQPQADSAAQSTLPPAEPDDPFDFFEDDVSDLSRVDDVTQAPPVAAIGPFTPPERPPVDSAPDDLSTSLPGADQTLVFMPEADSSTEISPDLLGSDASSSSGSPAVALADDLFEPPAAESDWLASPSPAETVVQDFDAAIDDAASFNDITDAAPEPDALILADDLFEEGPATASAASEGFDLDPEVRLTDAMDPIGTEVSYPPELMDTSALLGGEVTPQAIDDPGDSVYDISAADIEPLDAPALAFDSTDSVELTHPLQPSVPDLPPVPASELLGESAASSAAASPESASLGSVASVGQDINPLLKEQLHEMLEKIAWEAFSELSEQVVREVMQRVETIAWEVIPQMTEALIQEEIRRMQGGGDGQESGS
jgi:CheY-like chemotaxis protein